MTSARLAPNGGDVFVSLLASNATQDIYEAPFPKGVLNYVHVVDSVQDDTHPSPVTDPLRLFYEQGPNGARKIVEAARGQVGQEFAIVSTPGFADAGVQTREPYALANGATVYFTMEPGAVGGRDIYRAARTPGAWSVTIVGGVTSGLNEGHPVVSEDELVIFFTRTLPGSPSSVMMATREKKSDDFGAVLPVQGLAATKDSGAASDDRPTWLSADRCTLFFISDRSGEFRAYRMARR